MAVDTGSDAVEQIATAWAAQAPQPPRQDDDGDEANHSGDGEDAGRKVGNGFECAAFEATDPGGNRRSDDQADHEDAEREHHRDPPQGMDVPVEIARIKLDFEPTLFEVHQPFERSVSERRELFDGFPGYIAGLSHYGILYDIPGERFRDLLHKGIE